MWKYVININNLSKRVDLRKVTGYESDERVKSSQTPLNDFDTSKNILNISKQFKQNVVKIFEPLPSKVNDSVNSDIVTNLMSIDGYLKSPNLKKALLEDL